MAEDYGSPITEATLQGLHYGLLCLALFFKMEARHEAIFQVYTINVIKLGKKVAAHFEPVMDVNYRLVAHHQQGGQPAITTCWVNSFITPTW